MLSDYNGISLEINKRHILIKSSNIWKLNNIPQNKPWVKEDIKHETRNYF